MSTTEPSPSAPTLADLDALPPGIVDDAGDIVARAGDAKLLTAADVSARKRSELAETYHGAANGTFHEAANGTLFVSSGHPLTIGVLFDEHSSPGLVRVREARCALAANKRS